MRNVNGKARNCETKFSNKFGKFYMIKQLCIALDMSSHNMLEIFT